jgi:hypothetical protein
VGTNGTARPLPENGFIFYFQAEKASRCEYSFTTVTTAVSFIYIRAADVASCDENKIVENPSASAKDKPPSPVHVAASSPLFSQAHN